MAYFNIDNFLSKVANPDGFQRTTQFRCRIPVILIGRGALGERLYEKYNEASQLLNEGLLCEQTSTPSRAFETATLGIYGLDEKYPVFTTYTDHVCTFLTPLIKRGGKYHNDVANIFHEWQNGVQRRTDIFGDDANMVMKFPDEYRLTQGMRIDQFSTYNEKRRGGILGVNVNAQGNVRDGIEEFNRASRWFDGRQIPTSWTNRQNLDDEDSKPSLSYNFFNVFPQTVESTPLIWLGDADIQRVTVSFTYSYWSLLVDKAKAVETKVAEAIRAERYSEGELSGLG